MLTGPLQLQGSFFDLAPSPTAESRNENLASLSNFACARLRRAKQKAGGIRSRLAASCSVPDFEIIVSETGALRIRTILICANAEGQGSPGHRCGDRHCAGPASRHASTASADACRNVHGKASERYLSFPSQVPGGLILRPQSRRDVCSPFARSTGVL